MNTETTYRKIKVMLTLEVEVDEAFIEHVAGEDNELSDILEDAISIDKGFLDSFLGYEQVNEDGSPRNPIFRNANFSIGDLR